MVCASNQPIVGAANGKLPISSPSSLVQVSPGLAKGPAFDESFVLPYDMLDPLPQPITTYHDALTSDKLPFSHILIPASVTPIPSAAALKSLKILSKFWPDEIEEGEDCSLEVTSEDIPAASKEACPLTLKHQKKKNQQPKRNYITSPVEEIITRSKKGTSNKPSH